MNRWLLIVMCVFLCAATAQAQPAPAPETAPPDAPPRKPDNLLKLEEMPPRTVEQLLLQKPCDWVVLNTNDVVVVDPVWPRPDTLAKIQEQIAQKEQTRRTADAATRAQLAVDIDLLRKLTVTLADEADSPEYNLPILRIKQIVHHEDHMIRALDQMLKEGRLHQALELLVRLQRQTPNWPGVPEAGQRVLFTDARTRLQQGRAEEALVLLEELRVRNADYPQLSEQLGETVRALVAGCLAKQDYRGAQFFLNRLQQLSANHPVLGELSTQLADLAQRKMEEANAASQQGAFAQAALLADAATRIWPRSTELRAPHRRHTERYQVLKVGVLSLSGERRAYPVADEADERHSRLTNIPFFEIQRLRDGNTFYRTRVFDEWEPFDLGRTMRLTLKQFRQPSELQGVVTSGAVATRLMRQLDPQRPEYDERLASFISSVRILSARDFELTFTRVPPRIEPLLARLALPLPEEAGNEEVLDEPGGFRLVENTPDLRRYARRLPEPNGLQKYHVAEIVERRYESPDRALQALGAGEVSMLPDFPDWMLRRMSRDEDFQKRYFIQPTAAARTHLLQFNPRSQPLRIRELRAALAGAIDRDRILKETVLRDPASLHGRLITAPYLSSSPGLNVEVPQRKYDLSAAFALTLAAKKQLKDELPPLTMVVAGGIVPDAAAREIAAAWKQIGLTIKIVSAGDEPPPDWDILYRTLEMTEPVTEVWPFLTFSASARIDELSPYPDWLKQELVQLDRTSDQTRAVAALRALHRHLSDDVAFVPLWEVDRFIVFRKNCVGYPQKLLSPYDGIDQWTVDAWYQTEMP